MRSCTRSIAQGLLFPLLFAPPARAELAGEHVVSGKATFDRSGDVTTIHASDGAIINYDQFSVWSHEELHFVQPSSDARVLNRVLGDATHIDGGLYANGIVYIVNPAGIFFGGGAIVDVGGLYAAAGNISDGDFLARRDAFSLTGMVANEGTIESPAVALVGTAVANHGNISAPDGTIALVAGEKVLLTQLGAHLAVEVEGAAGGAAGAPALEQTGSVDAGAGSVTFATGDVYSLAINHTGITRGGEIDLRAASGTVSVAGALDASDRSAGATGGAISVTGERVALLGAQLDVSGDAGGGSIRVGGDRGGAGALPNAKRTFVDEGSALRADAISTGDGGQVIVWSDEATSFLGSLSARGGAAGGDGGFAEISGAVFLWSKGDVDLRAVSGANGTLLYDPKEIQLVGGSADGSDSPNTLPDGLAGDSGTAGQILFADVGDLASPFRVFESEIEGTNANVVLEATHSITSTGTFDHDASGEGAGVVRIIDGNSLTMRTRNNTGDDAGTSTTAGIHLSGVSFQTGGSGAITLATGNDGVGGGGTGASAGIDVADLTTAGGAVSVSTRSGSIALGEVTTTGASGATGEAAGAVTLTAGGTGSIAVGAIEAIGGSGATGVGAAGGAVTLTTSDGAITVASVDASGGDGSTSDLGAIGGGAGGAISLRANDADTNGNSDVTVTGDLISRGGAASAGDGGRGGAVTVRSDGVAKSIVPTPPPTPNQTPIVGGGAIDVANVDTRGGDGAAKGGVGGAVQLRTTDGAVSADDITTSGGDGGTAGGDAGSIAVFTRDADMQNDNNVALGALRAVGGTGTGKAGGAGGAINVQTERSLLITELGKPANVLQEAIGGGDVSIASIDSHGGDGGTSGGRGGAVTAQARGDGNTLAIAAPIDSSGGDGGSAAADVSQFETNNGGTGGGVTLLTQDSDLTVPAIDSRGGDAGTNGANNALGGSGGAVRITTGIEDTDQGNVLVAALIDAREGASGASATATTLSSVDGGSVAIVSTGNIDQVGAGPALTTSGSVSLIAEEDIGQATGGFLVRGGDERRTGTNGAILDEDVLSVTAGGTADVDVAAGGRFLGTLEAHATTLSADIEITQPGSGAGDRIALAGDGTKVTLSRADGTDNGVSLVVAYENPDDDAADGVLELATGSVTAGRKFEARSDGDLIVGTTNGTVITASAVTDPVTSNDLDAVSLFADNDGDGIGALLDTATGTGLIDLDAADPAHLVLFAAQGIGTASDPITTTGGGALSAAVEPRKQDANPATVNVTVPDPNADAGIFVHNLAGDLTITTSTAFTGIRGLLVAAGTGDVEITNDLGDIAVEGSVRSKPLIASAGTGGDLALRALDPASRIVLDTAPTFTIPGFGSINSIESGGALLLDGNVAVAQNASATAANAVTVTGAIDADASAASSALTITAGDTASFGGDVGAADPLTGLTVSAHEIVFGEAGNQRVVTETGGISLDGAGSPTQIPTVATVGKSGGDLSLETTGALAIGDGDKLSSAGRLDIDAASVRVTDLSALDIAVDSPTTQVFARAPGLVRLPSGDLVGDPGTDIVANTVSFTTAPVATGSGNTPRIATLSGSASNPGVFGETQLSAAVTPGQIAANGQVFDLAILVSDPGHETPELEGGVVAPPLELSTSQDEAGPGAPVSQDEVVAFLTCAPLGEEMAPSGCEPTAPPAYGSALDTERASEVARAYRELLGESARARAGRESLANAASDNKAELGAAASSAGRAYLTEIARVLGQVRLLGLGATYPEVRSDLLTAIAAAIGAPGLSAERLGAAVDARAMGMPI